MSALRVVNCSLTCVGVGWISFWLADGTTVSVAILLYQIRELCKMRDLKSASKFYGGRVGIF